MDRWKVRQDVTTTEKDVLGRKMMEAFEIDGKANLGQKRSVGEIAT